MSYNPPEGMMRNPAVLKAVIAHREAKYAKGISCHLESPTYISSKAHSSWRKHYYDHVGSWPPPVWVRAEPEGSHPAVSEQISSKAGVEEQPKAEEPKVEQPTLFEDVEQPEPPRKSNLPFGCCFDQRGFDQRR
jgi:hypothetical protein